MSSSRLTNKIDEERSRIHEQSQLVYLQGQIDELRRMMKDQTSKYQWVVEQTRKTESSTSQMEGMVEHHRENVAQSMERARRDIIELRKEVADAVVKVDEGTKPIREIQAQLQQLAEARKQDREYIAPWLTRIEDIEQKALLLHNQIRENEERHRQLALQLDRLREADTAVLQEVRKVGESIDTEKQSLRRQIVELEQAIEETSESTRDYSGRIGRVEEWYEQLKLVIDNVAEQISGSDDQIAAVHSEIKRVETDTNDWFMVNQERLEELRQQSNVRMDEMQDLEEQHMRQLSAWIDRLDGWVRELEQRLGTGVQQLEQANFSYRERVTDLEQREIQTLRLLADVVQSRLSSVESEQSRSQSVSAAKDAL
jgi:chromosome segregation ATPase